MTTRPEDDGEDKAELECRAEANTAAPRPGRCLDRSRESDPSTATRTTSGQVRENGPMAEPMLRKEPLSLFPDPRLSRCSDRTWGALHS